MKTFITLSFLFAVAFATAQTKPALPTTDFTMDLSENNVVLKPGDHKQITVTITRSKHYSKGKAILGFSSFLPKGVTILFDPTEENPDVSNALLTVAPDADLGVYQVVLSATINHKKMGAVLTLSIINESVAVK
jgi:hypothetical protein